MKFSGMIDLRLKTNRLDFGTEPDRVWIQDGFFHFFNVDTYTSLTKEKFCNLKKLCTKKREIILHLRLSLNQDRSQLTDSVDIRFTTVK